MEEIARGGMGVVYRARQVSLNRVVAVKMILSGRLASPREVERFQAEARAAASLQHPNIVPIHEVGEHEGQHYFSMEFVDGPNLSRVVRESPLPAVRAARYVRIISEAIQFAHDRDVLHRDLKPSNVLIDPFDQPRVTDFGLARRTTGESELTESGQVLGAPSFVPPEQAAGRKGEVGKHSDVYALGAILYYLLTGRPPFAAETLAATLAQVLNAEPAAPRLVNSSIPRDLETICLKCLEKKPQRRYASAQDLAAELGRFLRGEPIRARPVSPPERLWRWCHRNPAVARLLVLVTALLVTVAVGSTLAALWIAEARNAERQQRIRAEQGEVSARQMAYSAEMILSQQALQARNMGHARELLERQRPQPGQKDLRGWEWRYLWRQCHDTPSLTLGKHSSLVSALAFSPDGKWLLSSSLDRTATLWDLPARRAVSVVRHETPVWAAAFAPSGDQFATLAEDGRIQVRALLGGAEREFRAAEARRLGLRYPSSTLAFAVDGSRLAATSQGRVSVWDFPSGRASDSCELPEGEGYLPAFSPDLSLVALSSPEVCVLLWDVKAHSARARLWLGSKVYSYAQVFSPDGALLATACTDNSVKLWRVETAQLAQTLKYHRSFVRGLAFSPDSRILASGGFDQQVVLWDVATGRIRDVLAGHLDEVHSVAFSPDGQMLATGSKDRTVRLWDLGPRQDSPRFTALPGGLLDYGLSPDGYALFLREPNGRYTVWPVSPPGSAPMLTATNAAITGGAVAPRGSLLALAQGDGVIQLWTNRSAGFEPFRQWKAHTGRVQQMAFSADGGLLATVGSDDKVQVWSLTTLERVASANLPGSEVLSINFSPGNQRLGLGREDGTASVWDLRNRDSVTTLAGHAYGVSCVAFAPDGRVATVSADGTVKLWSLSEPGPPREVSTLRGPLTGLQTAVFSPDSRRLAAGGGVGEGELFVWDTTTGLQVARLPGHQQRVMALAFADDDTLVSVSPEAVRTWGAASWAEVEEAR